MSSPNEFEGDTRPPNPNVIDPQQTRISLLLLTYEAIVLLNNSNWIRTLADASGHTMMGQRTQHDPKLHSHGTTEAWVSRLSDSRRIR